MSETDAPPGLEREEAALAAALAWTTAATAHDEAAARAATADGHWDRGEDLLSDLFTQVARKGLIVEPLGIPHLCGDRGAQHATLSRAGLGRPLGDLFLLLVERDGSWQVVGATKVRPQVALFLSGTIDADAGPDTLPVSEAGLRWAALYLVEQALGTASDAAALPAELVMAASAGPGAALRAVRLDAANRHAVELRFGVGSEAWQGWVLLEGQDDALQAIDARRRLRWEALLRGIELSWPHEVAEAPSPTPAMGPDALRSFIRATMQSAMDAALAEAGPLPADDPRRAAPSELMALLDQALAAAPMRLDEIVAAAQAPAPTARPTPPSAPSAPPPAATTAPEADGPGPSEAGADAPPTGDAGTHARSDTTDASGGGAPQSDAPSPVRLPPKLQAAVGEVIAAHAKDGAATVDAEFLSQHGGELAGGLLRGLLQEVLPPTLELDVTVPKPSADGRAVQAEPVKVRVDLGSVLQNLFRPRPPGGDGPSGA